MHKSLLHATAIVLSAATGSDAAEFTGGSVGLGRVWFTNNDFDGDIDSYRVSANGDVDVTDRISVRGYFKYDSTTVEDFDGSLSVRTIGITPFYAVTENAKIGIFYEYIELGTTGLAEPYKVHAYGLEGSVKVTPRVEISAFYGDFDVEGSSDTIAIAGIGAEVMATDGVNLSIVRILDPDDYYGITTTTLGVSYDLQGVVGVPIAIEGSYSFFGDVGENFDQLYLGARFMFGERPRAPSRFSGERQSYVNATY